MTSKLLETVSDPLREECHGKARRKQIFIEQKKRRWVQKLNLIHDSHMQIQKILYKTNIEYRHTVDLESERTTLFEISFIADSIEAA